MTTLLMFGSRTTISIRRRVNGLASVMVSLTSGYGVAHMKESRKFHRIGSCIAALTVVGILSVSMPATARDWISPHVRAAAEQMLAAMPDDYHTIKDVAAAKEIDSGTPLVLDVREPNEFAVEHIPRAKNIALRGLLKTMEALPSDKSARIIVYCKTGHRGAVALAVLRMIGYSNVLSLYGGLDGWKAAGFVVTKSP